MTPLEVTGGHLKIQVTQIFSTMKAVVKHTLAAVAVKNSADEWKRCKEWTRFRCVIRGVGRIFGEEGPRGRAPSELDGGDRLPPDPESADVTDLAKLL